MSEETVDLIALKKARFEKDPDSFIAVEDIVMCAVRTETGIGIIHGASKRFEMEQALTRLQYKTFQIFMGMDAENIRKAMEKEDSGIIVPGGNGGNGRHRNPLVR